MKLEMKLEIESEMKVWKDISIISKNNYFQEKWYLTNYGTKLARCNLRRIRKLSYVWRTPFREKKRILNKLRFFFQRDFHSSMANARSPGVSDITSDFCRLTLESSKEETLEWLRSNFPESEPRATLIAYLSRPEHRVEDKFYHKDKECVIFYFQVYNRRSEQSHCKQISLRTASKITSKNVKHEYETLLDQSW